MDKPFWLQEEFWVAVTTAILVVLNQGLGLGIDPEPILYIVALVFAWIIGTSVKKAAVTIREAVVMTLEAKSKK